MSHSLESINSQISGNATQEVLKLGKVHLEGNITPHTWYQNIRLESGSVDSISITLLSEIVYWYRPTYINDEITGMPKAINKKFKKDALQKRKKDLANKFGYSEKQVQQSLLRLEKMGLIRREFRTITQKDGAILPNTMFIHIFPDAIQEITEFRVIRTNHQDDEDDPESEFEEDCEDEDANFPPIWKKSSISPPSRIPDTKTPNIQIKSTPHMEESFHIPGSNLPYITEITPNTSSLDYLRKEVIIADPKEQTPAAGNNNFSARKKKEKKVYTCLKDLNIHEHTKQDITAKYTEEKVQHAAQLLTHKDSQYHGIGIEDATRLIQHALNEPWRYEKTIANLGQPKLTKLQREAKEREIAQSDNDTKQRQMEQVHKKAVSKFKDKELYNDRYQFRKWDDRIAFFDKHETRPGHLGPIHPGSIEFSDKDFIEKFNQLLKVVQP